MKLPDEPFEAFDYVLCSGERCDHCVHIRSYFSDLRSLCEQLKEDAERYRWLRGNRVKFGKDFGIYEITIDAGQFREHWDAAIDAARKESDDKA